MSANLTRIIGGLLVALSTALVIVAGSILVFANPLWVGFEQARTSADRLTGYTIDDVHRVTNGILGELLLGPATFLQQVAGATVLDPRERQHMADVRTVMLEFFALALIAVAFLVLAGWRSRDRSWLWRSVAAGAAGLSAGIVFVGIFAALFFDQTFEFFHELFFPAGSFDFDPTTERLVQLFPMDFWSETAILLVVVILAISLVVAWIAVRRSDLPAVAVASPDPRPGIPA